MRTTEIDRRIATLAAKQHDAFSREQAFRAGATDRLVHRRLAAGDWLRPEPAVYTLASSAGSWLQRCKVAELSVTGAGLAGPTAAVMHDLVGFGPSRPEIAVPVNSNCRSRLAICHRYSGATFTTVNGFKVTTVAQTLFDVAIAATTWRIERALDDALVRRKVTLDELDERARCYAGRGRTGAATMEALLAERRAEGWSPPESVLEQRLLDVLVALPSRPRIVRQAPAPWRDVLAGRVDALLPDHRLIVEADGRRWHTRIEDFERDRWRDNQATASGYGVLRFTWVHLHAFVADVVELIERSLRAAA